jgi:hypothetical protein
MPIHPSITTTKLVNAIKRDDGTGYCTVCGRKAKHFCEPDLDNQPCQFKGCGALAVCGAEQILLKVQA